MKISIITISLNDLENLKKTIASVQAQNFSNIEHLVVDGKSTDGTLEYLNTLSHPGFSFRSEKDTGLYNAMNKGIKQISGDYILFLNAGDTFHSSKSLNQAARFLGKHDFVYFDIFLKFSKQVVLRRYPEQITYKFWLCNHLCHQACFYAAQIFQKVGLYDEALKIAADHDHFLRIFKDPSLSKLHAPLATVVYDMSGISSSPENREKTLNEMTLSERKHLPRIKRFFYGRRVMFQQKIERATNRWARFFLRTFVSPLGIDPAPEDSVVDHEFDKMPKEVPRLNVLIVNSYESKGGAAVAASRIHSSLRQKGVLSTMLVLEKNSNSAQVIKARTKKGPQKIVEIFLNLFEVMLKALCRKRAGGSLVSPGFAAWTDLAENVAYLKPDIVHLNWIHDKFSSISDLPQIKKPILWTMHDMWSFCGAEHVTTERRFETGYKLKTLREWVSPASLLYRYNWLRKKRIYRKIKNLSFTSPSRWMHDCMLHSELLKGYKSLIVANGLDPAVFFAKDKKTARDLLNIPQDKKVLMFGALDVTKDPNKGFHLLLQALQKIQNSPLGKDIYVLVCGYMDGSTIPKLDFPIRPLGFVTDNTMLAAVYSAVDVMVIPSRIESFGQSATEAMACGVPVVAFNTSGLKDIVDHQKNGYLAQCYDPMDFANGIEWVLENKIRWQELSQNAQSKVKQKFTSDIIADQLIGIYEQLKTP